MMKPSSVKKASESSNLPKLQQKPSNNLTAKNQTQKKIATEVTDKRSSVSKITPKVSTATSFKKQQQTMSSMKKVSAKNIMQKKPELKKQEVKKSVVSNSMKSNIMKPQGPFLLNNKKQTENKNYSWGFLPFDLFLMVCHFYSNNVYDIYSLSLVCKGWMFHLSSEQGKYCWLNLKDCEKIENFKGIKALLQQNLIKTRQKMAVQYEKNFIKLFNYGSTKQNIPNKLIDKLNLSITVEINKKKRLEKIPFKLKTFNFSSYLCFKLTQVQEFKYDFYTPHNMFKNKLHIEVKFFSRRYKVSHEIKYELLPEDIVECSIRQKAFNYHLDKNLILTFFEGDDHFLYFFFEISALELVNIFRNTIAESQKEIIKGAMKKVPLHKKLAETQFQSFIQYMKFQADFELHMSYHNSIKQIFTFCDTKVYPLKYDNKQAYFMIKIDDTFSKVDTYKLDNKMGISEGVPNLYLLDLTLKDRDKFLITFSGFIYARKAELKERESVEDYFNFSENEMKVLVFKSKKFEFKILVIEQEKKNFIKNIQLVYFA